MAGVSQEVQTDDQDHHPPDLARVEDLIGPERLVGQDGKDDEGNDDELQKRLQVVVFDPAHDDLERVLEVQQDSDRGTDDHGQGPVSEDDVGAHEVHQ